ncbi:MAG: SUF system NifU family Fe-S cluster assembly protein [Dietzia sp.]|uniref:Fe-S cluster assembly sulfur transfer protein SufU n=1 Tax=Dietzia TaxID=37914 RepID=UPI0015CB4CCE|nr:MULTISPECIES: SUF system NifU family Fe-S cluster assembly protein [Dietzia]MBB1034663.1 SUF system NifU family Fe-S cluster assembly protein [Dietzia sp. CQ4]MBB1036997.1 SUF system NifU family Fe-S cluster assembly protein [Dietzia natronolimnaea]MBB1040022.1 SUF system NifU family Fe-S cluster assembly protein [Dietzia sp. Cai40]MBB1043171.1 SUF system NifU family Fe-S cluster assembly protein [Dietzia sp. DQ11-44]MBB1049652.1 SUF system NifU family Fe-S cluster assembly protein [Dietzia
MKLEQMYQEVILDHYRHPHHSGLREPFGAEVHHVNPTCGDELTLRLQLSDDRSTIEDVSYDAQGCSISQASTSMMADLIVGRTVSESLEAYDAFHEMISSRGKHEGDEEILDDAVALSGVSRYPARVKCALLGWMAYRDALGRQTEQHQE